MTLSQEQTITSTPDMLTLPPYVGRERIIHIHEDAYCTILFRG